jgi:hypothetical protein
MAAPFGLSRTAVVIAVVLGAAGSAGLTLYAGQRVGAPRLLQALFTLWVGSPFVGLAVGCFVSKRWSVLTRATLDRMVLVLTVASLAIYAAVALGASRPKTAVFVMVAPASWAVMVIAVATAAFMSRRSG